MGKGSAWKYLAPIACAWVVGRLLRHPEYDLNFLLVSALLVTGLMWAVEGVRRRASDDRLEKLRRDVLYVYCGLYQEGKDKGQFKGTLLQMTKCESLDFEREMETGRPMVWELVEVEVVGHTLSSPGTYATQAKEKSAVTKDSRMYQHRMFACGGSMAEDHFPTCQSNKGYSGHLDREYLTGCPIPTWVNMTKRDYCDANPGYLREMSQKRDK